MATATLPRSVHTPPIDPERRTGERRGCILEHAAKGAVLNEAELRALCGGDPWEVLRQAAGVSTDGGTVLSPVTQ